MEVAQAGQLYYLAYIDKDVKMTNGQRALSHAPYQGPGWYNRTAQEFCLYHGILGWPDFNFGLNASAHLPNDCLTQPIAWIQKAWGGWDKRRKKKRTLRYTFWPVGKHDGKIILCSTSKNANNVQKIG